VGFTLEFDGKNGVVRLTLDGILTDEILSNSYAALAKFVSSHGPCRAISDATKVTKFYVSSAAVRELARSAPAVPVGYMRVFVAPRDELYGMARMFQILGDKTRPDLHVVRTLEDAYRLLKIEAPEFVPVS